jgi:cytochrome P450
MFLSGRGMSAGPARASSTRMHLEDPRTTVEDRLERLARSDEYRRDPYPHLAELREAWPLHRSALGPWVVTRYEDAARIVRDPDVSNGPLGSGPAAVQGAAELARAGVPCPVNALDRPAHGRVRALVTAALGLATERVAGAIQPHVDRLLDGIRDRGEGPVDVVEDLGYPLPLAILCELLGVAPEDGRLIRGWGHALAEGGDPERLVSEAQRAAAAAAQREFAAYFTDLIMRRRRQRGDDLVSALMTVRHRGDRLSAAELVVNGMFVVVNGYHNTVNLIANGVLALLRHPDQLARLRSDPSLGAAAVEELLRYDCPIHSIARATRSDLQVAGVTVPAGSQLMLLVGAAHRDGAVFPDPDRLDIERSGPARTLAFGGGAHACPGAGLARSEARAAICSLVSRFPRLRLAGEPRHAGTFTLRGLTALPVHVR